MSDDEKFSALEERLTARNRAAEVIYSHINSWLGTDLKVGENIPVVRNGAIVSELTKSSFGGIPQVQKILDGSEALGKGELVGRKKTIEKVSAKAKSLLSELHTADSTVLMQATMRDPLRNALRFRDTNERVINALGVLDSVEVSLGLLANQLEAEATSLDARIESHGPKKGRYRDEEAFEVALAAARLFKTVCGEEPTYSENSDGLSGKYTPFLKDLFVAFGWPNRTLKDPANTAKLKVASEDLELSKKPTNGGISFGA